MQMHPSHYHTIQCLTLFNLFLKTAHWFTDVQFAPQPVVAVSYVAALDAALHATCCLRAGYIHASLDCRLYCQRILPITLPVTLRNVCLIGDPGFQHAHGVLEVVISYPLVAVPPGAYPLSRVQFPPCVVLCWCSVVDRATGPGLPLASPWPVEALPLRAVQVSSTPGRRGPVRQL